MQRGRTALYFAQRERRVEIKQLLLKYGADTNSQNKVPTESIQICCVLVLFTIYINIIIT